MAMQRQQATGMPTEANSLMALVRAEKPTRMNVPFDDAAPIPQGKNGKHFIRFEWADGTAAYVNISSKVFDALNGKVTLGSIKASFPIYKTTRYEVELDEKNQPKFEVKDGKRFYIRKRDAEGNFIPNGKYDYVLGRPGMTMYDVLQEQFADAKA